MKLTRRQLKRLILTETIRIEEGWADQIKIDTSGMKDSLKSQGWKEDNMWDLTSHEKAYDTFHSHLAQAYDYKTDFDGNEVQVEEERETGAGTVSIVPCPSGLTVLIGKYGAPDLLVAEYSKKSDRKPKTFSKPEKAVVAFVEKYGGKFKTDNEKLKVEKSGLTPYIKLSVNGYSICFVP